MTTVVYRDGVLAFDSRISDGDAHVGWCNKGRQTKQFIMAGAGAAEDMEAAMDWIEAGAKIELKPKFDLHEREVECEILVADKDGNVTFYGGRLYPTSLDAQYYAIGSGSPYALGAFAAGADARSAVMAAIKHDLYSGGTVRTLSFKKEPLNVKKKNQKARK